MNTIDILNATETFVKKTLDDAEGGHDWWHIKRVRDSAKTIGLAEGADLFIVELAALLHDIADHKFHDGNESIGSETAARFLFNQSCDKNIIKHIVDIIDNISFKGGQQQPYINTIEFKVVQDADRLDAIGAIGIARAFNYGGFRNRPLFDPNCPPNPNMDKATYMLGKSPTINHFYEKLLLLKDRMNTQKGKELAEQRHSFMEQFLDQFYKEWNE